MSGLVFVRDVQARPLMPTSAANARVLLRDGKANLWPHPTLTIVELTKSIPTPTLRPVLLCLALQRQTANLILLIDNARAAVVKLRIVVDLNLHIQKFGRVRRQGKKMSVALLRHKRSRFVTAGYAKVEANSISRTRKLSRALIAVITTLQQLLPISHLLVLPSRLESMRRLFARRWVERQVVTVIAPLDSQIALLDVTTLHQAQLSAQLYHTLTAVLTELPSSAPDLVACWLGGLPGQLKRPRPAYVQRWLPTQSTRRPQVIGQACTIHNQGHRLTGLVHTYVPDGRLRLRVPMAVTRKGVVWQRMLVSSVTPRAMWDRTSVALLPLGR